MQQSRLALAMSAVLAANMLFSASQVFAEDKEEGKEKRYEVTVTNLTRGQPFAPIAAISHNKDFELFMPGEPAIPALVPLVEDGNTGPLLEHVKTMPSVFAAVTNSLVDVDIPPGPGQAVTLQIKASGSFKLITVAGMLATTNDAFWAVHGVEAPKKMGEAKTFEAVAYDAGSERNSELCGFIPGPPCAGPGVRDHVGSEGYVHIHAGIHGIGDLAPATFDWRNPVAEIIIRRIH